MASIVRAVQLVFGLPVFNCVSTIEAICMLVTIHLHSASQQHLVIAITMLSTIKIHMVPYKYTCKASLQFPCTFAGESPKWNTLVVTWALVICLKYMHEHEGAARVRVHIFFRQITRAHITTTTYYICSLQTIN